MAYFTDPMGDEFKKAMEKAMEEMAEEKKKKLSSSSTKKKRSQSAGKKREMKRYSRATKKRLK